jgi:signal transduction histidine kinase
LAFAIPATVPIMLEQASEGGRIHYAMAFLTLIFCTATTLVSGKNERRFKQSIRLRLRNQFLVDDLAAARQKLAAANSELEAKVEDRTQALQRALSERDSFVSVVSHELRTPLTALKLNQDALQRLLQQRPLDPEKVLRSFLPLPRQVARIQRLVNDLLDVSRLSTDQMRYVKAHTELREVIQESLDQLAPQLASADATFKTETEPGLAGLWDRDRIEQVLLNLMSNALHYGAPPYSLVAQRVDHCAHIVVRDHGPGISPENLQRIFEPFQRATADRKPAGLGLGLYIADRIVRAHEGKIRAESSQGEGAAFILELPLS